MESNQQKAEQQVQRTKNARIKRKARSEFRYNFNKDHKQYVFEETDKKYKSVGITSKKETFGIKNMPLKKNPQKGKTEKAYIRNGIVSDKKSSYSKKRIKNLSFTVEDMANIKAKIRHYKKVRSKGQ